MLYIVYIILQQFVEFQIEIHGSLVKQSVFKVARGHPTTMAKLPIMASEAENKYMEYLINP